MFQEWQERKKSWAWPVSSKKKKKKDTWVWDLVRAAVLDEMPKNDAQTHIPKERDKRAEEGRKK